MVLIFVVLVAVVLTGYLTQPKAPNNQVVETVLQDYCGSNVDEVTAQLDDLGIHYEITYVTDSGFVPGTVIRHTPGPGTVLNGISNVDLVVANDRVTVPDFSGASSVAEVLELASPHLTVELLYLQAETGLFFEDIPQGMVIDYIECNDAAGAELPLNSEITVTIYLKYQYDLVGQWYSAECTYGTLYLTNYHFREDGTFDYGFTGYMAVDYETDLYTYETYWDGAMGDDSHSGTYRIEGNQLILNYEYWDWNTETTQNTTAYYSISMTDAGLNLTHDASLTTAQYLPGSRPDPDAVLPFRIDGSWYALGTPEDGSALPVHTFYFWSNGEFKSNRYNYLRGDAGWYFPGAGSTYAGNYTFDGTQLVLHYTRELVSVHDDEGNYIGTEPIAMEKTYALILTVDNGQITNVACDALDLSCMVRIDPSPYVNVDIMGAPMEYANLLFP